MISISLNICKLQKKLLVGLEKNQTKSTLTITETFNIKPGYIINATQRAYMTDFISQHKSLRSNAFLLSAFPNPTQHEL